MSMNTLLNQFVDEVSELVEDSKETIAKLKDDSVSETLERINQTEMEKEKILDISRLPMMTKPELSVLCKKYNLKVSGKKEELVERIKTYVATNTNSNTNSNPVNVESKINSNTNSSVSSKSKPVRKTKEEKEKEKKEKEEKEKEAEEKKERLYSQFEKTIIKIRRNAFGNFEHMETGLIFDRYDKNVIGKQCSSGKILPLTEKDIMVCKTYNFDYLLPYDLNDEETKTKYSDTLKNELEENEDGKDDDLDKLENPIDEDEEDEEADEEEDEEEGGGEDYE